MTAQSHLPWGIYVHVPWCRRRCPYCDFAFEVGTAREGFSAAVLAEADARRHQMPVSAAQTLSFGGGTPTSLSDAALGNIIAGLWARKMLAEDVEISIEANPEDLTSSRAEGLAAAGFNRISLGVQSFDDPVLKLLGRGHDAHMARTAVDAVVALGLRTSVDLIIGVPEESPSRLQRDLEVIEATGVGHVSAYVLTIEEGTPWVRLIARNLRRDVDHDAQADALELTQARLTSMGLRQYEISSYAIAGQESRHNRLYWAKGHYLGLGPSAHSLQINQDGIAQRRANGSDINAYLLADPASVEHTIETVPAFDAFREAVSFGLRDLVSGISLESLGERHQVASHEVDVVAKVLAQHLERGNVVSNAGRWHLTSLGARFADAVARDLWDDSVVVLSPRGAPLAP